MQEDIIIVILKEEDVYMEVCSGTEEELSDIRDSIKELLDGKETKEVVISQEEYNTCKNNKNMLEELYNR